MGVSKDYTLLVANSKWTGKLPVLVFALAAFLLATGSARAWGLTEVFGFADTYSAQVIHSADGNFYGVTDSSGVFRRGSLFRLTPDGTMTTLFSFGVLSNGLNPNLQLLQANDGFLYGTTFQGGIGSISFGVGTVFKCSTNGVFQTLVVFDPFAGANAYPLTGLIQGSDGNLYGTSSSGGVQNAGTVFKMSTDGASTAVLYTFSTNSSNGYNPNSIIQGQDGNFYGTTQSGGPRGGVIYGLNTNGTITFSVPFFVTNGVSPFAGLIQGPDGTFYGTTFSGRFSGQSNGFSGFGTVFSITTNSPINTLVYFNSTNGASPQSPLAFGSDGNLYGATTAGGPNNLGSIFELTTNGSFSSLEFFNGANGANPSSALVSGGDGNLYGTTATGGADGNGTLFQVTTTGGVNTLFSFPGASSSTSYARVMRASDGNYYGTAFAGGTYEYGTVFKMDTSGVMSTLYSFGTNPGQNGNPADGIWPMAGLVQGADGNLYGTTSAGGPFGDGTVFQLTLNGSLTTLGVFNGTNGANPQAELTQGADGSFFGTTLAGGTFGRGTVFNVTTNGSLTSLVSFNGTNGANPYSGLAQMPNGLFYGTSLLGGTNHIGNVFSMTSNGSLTTLISFNRTNGASPYGTLIVGSDGNFYGTTAEGGATNCGTIFRISTSGTFTNLASFRNTNGANPMAGLILGTDGGFYGTTRSSLSGFGTIFRAATNGTLTTLTTFTSLNGANPQAALALGTNDDFLGTTISGGSRGFGNLFDFSIRPGLHISTPSAGLVSLTWDTIPGLNYQLQSSTSPRGTWNTVGTVINASGSTTNRSDNFNASQSASYYRVVLMP
jgi:uncharacterized repeat protein (TIGR03803 family)